MPAPSILEDPLMLWFCVHCDRFTASHPLDHLDEAHPPEFADGSRVLPQRFALT